MDRDQCQKYLTGKEWDEYSDLHHTYWFVPSGLNYNEEKRLHELEDKVPREEWTEKYQAHRADWEARLKKKQLPE